MLMFALNCAEPLQMFWFFAVITSISLRVMSQSKILGMTYSQVDQMLLEHQDFVVHDNSTVLQSCSQLS